MKLYNIYLGRKIISYFLVIFLTLILLIWSARAITFVEFITEKGVGLGNFLHLFVLILPWLSTILIPVSLFIAVTIVYNQMLSYNEITIFRNAGLNNPNLVKSTILIAIICCLICYYISFFLMPFANKKLRSTKLNFNNNYINLIVSPGIFETINKLSIYVQTKDKNDQLFGILVYDDRYAEYSVTITAKSGSLKQEDQNDDSLLLYLNSGTIERFYRQSQKLDILHFDSYVINLSEDTQSPTNIKWKANERYIGELLHPDKDSSPQDLKNYSIELHERIANPLLPLILTLIATSTILNSKFSRYGNLVHSLKAIAIAVIFISLLIISFNLNEYFGQFAPITYLILLFFIIFCSYRLKFYR